MSSDYSEHHLPQEASWGWSWPSLPGAFETSAQKLKSRGQCASATLDMAFAGERRAANVLHRIAIVTIFSILAAFRFPPHLRGARAKVKCKEHFWTACRSFELAEF